MEYLLCSLLVSIALYTDLKVFKIKNQLTGSFIVLGLLYHFVQGNLINSLGGLIFPLILFPLFALRMMFAGDIKLFCALGAVVCFPNIVGITLLSIVLNGIIAMVLLITRKNGRKRFQYLFDYIKRCFLLKTILQYTEVNREDNGFYRYTYGIAICVYLYSVFGLLGLNLFFIIERVLP